MTYDGGVCERAAPTLRASSPTGRANDALSGRHYGVVVSLATERLLPAGSVNQAIEWPSP